MMLKSYEVTRNMVHKVTSIILPNDLYVNFSIFNNFIDKVLFNCENYSMTQLELVRRKNSHISNV